MAKIVLTSRAADTVLLQDIARAKTYVYTSNTGGLWILSKLGRYVTDNSHADKLNQGKYHYGFVRIDKVDEVPVFTTANHYDSIEKAINSGRKVLEFDTFREVMKWKLKIE